MGIKNLMKVIKRYSPKSIKDIKIDDLQGKKVAVDANLFIYKSVFAIRSGMGKDIMHGDKKVSHLYIMFIRLCGMLLRDIKPIFVFDYAYPDIKDKCIKERKERRREYKKMYLLSKDEETKKKYYHICEDISRSEYSDILELLTLMGIPHIFSPEEADTQCAYLINSGHVDYVVSDDMDLLMFGCRNIVKGFTLNKYKKMQLITLKDVLKGIQMDQRSLIHLGILLGSDYAETVKGVGYVKAYAMIKKYISIPVAKLYKEIPHKYRYEKAYSYFSNKVYKEINSKNIEQKSIKKGELRNFLYKNGFASNKTINNNLDKILL